MPRKVHKLTGIRMPDVNDKFRRRSNSEPPSIVKLQAIAVSHGNGVWKIQQQILAMIVSKTNATAVSLIKIKSERAHCRSVGPLPGGSVTVRTREGSVDSSHINT
jgi:hypothetical protein